MNDNEKLKVKLLVEECGFAELTAQVYVAYNGKCVYCGEDLVKSSLGYSSGTIDHLLPKSKHPNHEWNENNLVLSCGLCNSLKSGVDILQQGEDPTDMLENSKLEMIRRAKKVISDKIGVRHQNWWKARQILRGI